MANAKKCDRCGKFYDFYEGVEFINNCCSKYVGVTLEGRNKSNPKYFDLCEDCMQKTIYFLKNKHDEEKEGE